MSNRSQEPQPLQVLVVAGYPALRAGLAALLAMDDGLEPVDDRAALLPPGSPANAMLPATPDVIVADANSISELALDDLHDRYPAVPFVFMGASLTVDQLELLDQPAGYLPAEADAPALAATVRAVAQGLTVIAPGLIASGEDVAVSGGSGGGGGIDHLTPREREVLILVANGLPNKAIARELGISEHTAKFHVGSLLGKLGAASRAEAVMLATRRGLLSV